MQEIIITTPEQLKSLISETVKDELRRQSEAQTSAKKCLDKDLLIRKQLAQVAGVVLLILNQQLASAPLSNFELYLYIIALSFSRSISETKRP